MEPLRAQKQDVVGYKKTVATTATLYRDGTLMVDAVTDCNNSFHGLRGRITVLALDQGGRAVGVSQEMRCTTRGGLLDVFTCSSGRDTFTHKFPESVGQEAVTLEIFHGDDTLMGGDKLERLIRHANNVRTALAVFE